jgi:riboflavin synthase
VFTGLVEETGRIASMEGGPEGMRLWIRARLAAELAPGDSVAVSGVCLTVTAVASEAFAVEAVPETLRVTTLGERRPGDMLNLERAVPAGGRLGGHLVQGHVDGVGRLLERRPRGNSVEMRFAAPPEVMRYVAPKGSVAVDGVSLTVVDRPQPDAFRVAVIPYTAAVTTLGGLREGDRVNLEADVVAKYLEVLAAPYLPGAGARDREG